ncbi:MAG: ligase-associated DNA damage response DEXH box helicase [Caulobacteraceae bacterium]
MDCGAGFRLEEPFASWFARRGWELREHQRRMIEKAREARSALLIAPTGSGKTLAGFLPSLIDLEKRSAAPGRETHTLYISPLKALAVDVERNLLGPIAEMGLKARAESRTGDTGLSRRQRQKSRPPDILLTTPEQLALFLAWEGARQYFSNLRCVIIDEVHSLWRSKRGDLLSLGLARLQRYSPACRRVGLSATVAEPDLIRDWLSPELESEVDLVRGGAGASPIVDVLFSDGRVPWTGHTARHAMADVYEAICRARTALVFVNTRFQAEFAFQELWRLNEDNLPIALHHGSLAAGQRRKVEAAMARGELRAVVCTSTLDLGVDWGDVDLVIQLASPKGASRMIQRIGRANHRLDEPSRALFVPANCFETLECQAAREAIAEGALDAEAARIGALDVLAQHVMGCACSEPFEAKALFEEARGAAPYRNLDFRSFEEVIALVATGGYPLSNYDRFARIVQDRQGLWKVRDGRMALRHRMNIGAIVSPAMLSVRIAGSRSGAPGRKIGEVEEGYLEALEIGDAFVFAGRVWRLSAIEGADVLVRPAPGAEAKMPSWGGSKFALSTFLAGRVRAMMSNPDGWASLPFDVREWMELQRTHSVIPAEEEMLVETFPRGSRHFLVCYPFEGRLAHTTLAMLLTRRLDRLAAGPIGFTCNDYALAIWAMRPMGELDLAQLFSEDMLGDDLEAWLAESSMMKLAFKSCALISGLIERRFPQGEKKGRQISFSTDLIYDVLRRHQPDHLLLACARTDAAEGMIEISRLGGLLKRVRGGLRHASLDHLSPFSVQAMAEIGRQRSPGSAAEMALADIAEDLIAEARA